MDFGVAKFRSLLLAGSFTVLAGSVVRLTDSVVAGRLIGSAALAGVNLAAPVLSAVSFLAGLIATGLATNYSLSLGRLEKRRAHEFFAQALWSTLLFGGALALAVLFGRDAFLTCMGADAATTAHAAGYLRWLWPVAVLQCVEALLVALGYADGDAKLCAAAYAVLFAVKVLVTTAAVASGMGTAGCALGSVAAEAAAAAVMAGHFLRRSNSCRLVRHFALADSARIVRASFGDAAAFLCDALLFLFLNKFVIDRFGSDWLPVIGVVSTLWGFLVLFNGIGTALQPIVTAYFGEGNTKSVATVMGAAMKASLAEGLALTAAFALWPELVVRLVGVGEPDLVREGCVAVRWVSCGFVALAFAGLYNSYYMFVGRAPLAGVVTFACYLAAPIASVAAFSLAGARGTWAGLGLGPAFGCAASALVVLAVCGRRQSPLALDRSGEKNLVVIGLRLEDSEIVSASRQVAGELVRRGVAETTVLRASLMTEEVFMVVKDRNRGRTVLGEAVLDLSDGVRLTLRDDGEIFDITDADAQISSLRTFLVASVMERQPGRVNLVTTGFNRNVFKF